jgi:drug/metabolite transporter (DMT)-like permease
LGFALAGFGMLIIPVGDAIAKHLTGIDYHVLQIAWGRWVSHLVILTPVVLLAHGPRSLRPHRVGLHTLRALLLVGATVCYFFALRFIPLANAAAIIFVAPLIVTALSGLMLGEHVGLRRWTAVLAGFAGMLLIVRPGLGTTHWGAGFALAAAVGFSFYLLLTRKVAGRTPPLVTLWFMGVVGTVAMSPFAVPVWQAPDLEGWMLMAAIGGVMALGHLCIITAMDVVEASAGAPLVYLEMVTATTLGYFWFGDFPDALTWTGCAAVIAAGLFIAYRERVLSQRTAGADVPVR